MTQQQMKIREALLEARTSIDPVDARILISHALQTSKEYLAAHPDHPLTADEADRFLALVGRRAAGEPIAYLIGMREFYGRPFEVTPSVLIPRPETELLVELALERIAVDRPADILDLGTGSGAIAITLACERPGARVSAIDASKAALDVASSNACRLIGTQWASRLTLLQGDWYMPVARRRFHLIVANPPYIADGDPHLAEGDLRFEPVDALTPGGDGLDALSAIAAGASSHILPGGWLICEHGYDQAERVRALFVAEGLTQIASAPDLAGIPRATVGKRPCGD